MSSPLGPHSVALVLLRCRVGPLLLALALVPAAPAAIAPAATGPEPVRDLRTGQHYPAGTRVRSPFLGFSFVIPPQWRGTLPAGNQTMLLESTRRPGIGVVLLLEGVTPADVQARLSEPQALDEAFILHPTGPVSASGPRLRAAYAVGSSVGRATAIVGPAGKAVLFLLAGPKEEGAYYDRLLDGLDSSTRFDRPESAAALRAWYDRLSGKMLTRRLAASVAGEPAPAEVWHLCSDGRFAYQRTGTAARSSDSSGFWRIEREGPTASLVLSPEHAGERTHPMGREGEQLLFEGAPVEEAMSDACL